VTVLVRAWFMPGLQLVFDVLSKACPTLLVGSRSILGDRLSQRSSGAQGPVQSALCGEPVLGALLSNFPD
jgi:hypothetical protein